MKKTHISSLCLLFALVAAMGVGCMPPSPESVKQEVNYVRQRAYEEWKASRDRGESKEPKIDGGLSIDDAVRLALRYNKQLRIDVENREIARGYRKSAWNVLLPSLGVTSNLIIREKMGGQAMGAQTRDSYDIGLTVTQPIWQGKAIPATLRDASLNSALVDENIRATVEQLVETVADLYYQILYHQHLLETQKEGLRSAEEQLRMISEKRKQETATDLEVLTAQVDVAKYQAETIREQNSIDNFRVELLKAMGCSLDSKFTLTDKLEFLPMRPVFDQAVCYATTNRADLRVAELSVRRQIEAVRIAESEFFPYISAYISDGWGTSWRGGHFASGRDGVTAGLRAQYNLGIDNWGDLQQARAKQVQQEIALLDAQETAMRDILTAMNDLANAEQMVNATQVNQDSAREALRLATVGYQAGVKTELDVTNARKQLTDVQGQYYGALYEHTAARVALQVAMGLLGPCYVKDGAQMPPNVPIANIEEFKAHDYVPPKPFVSPSEGKKDEAAPRARRRRTTGRDVRGSIRDLRAGDLGDDEEKTDDEKDEGKEGESAAAARVRERERQRAAGGAADRSSTLRDRLGIGGSTRESGAAADSGAAGTSRDTPARTGAAGQPATSRSAAIRESLDRTGSNGSAADSRQQTPEERARSFSEREAERERLQRERQRARDERLNRVNQGRNGAGNGNGSRNGAAGADSAEMRVREARQRAADIAAEAKEELQSLERTTGSTSGDMKEAVRQAEEAIKGARDAVRDFDAGRPAPAPAPAVQDRPAPAAPDRPAPAAQTAPERPVPAAPDRSAPAAPAPQDKPVQDKPAQDFTESLRPSMPGADGLGLPGFAPLALPGTSPVEDGPGDVPAGK